VQRGVSRNARVDADIAHSVCRTPKRPKSKSAEIGRNQRFGFNAMRGVPNWLVVKVANVRALPGQRMASPVPRCDARRGGGCSAARRARRASDAPGGVGSERDA